MPSLWSRFVAPLGRAVIGAVAALVLVAMATPAFDAAPAQARGLPWPSPLHLSQPPNQASPGPHAPPGPQAPPGRQGSLTEFDAPGANTVYSSTQYTACNTAFLGAIGCGTTALANNNLGDVVGTYTDAGIVQHGFLRYPDGSITSFDAPGAGSAPGQGTVAYAISNAGVIAGAFQDANYVYHGFLRYPDGVFVTIDVPGAGAGVGQGTLAFDVNPAGTTTGTYLDANGLNHGFVRSATGTFALFDPSGSSYTYPCEETCLSPDGSVTGVYVDAMGPHGFVRAPSGAITPVNGPPNALGAIGVSINPAGVVAAYYATPDFLSHGLVWYRHGSPVTFDDPAASPTRLPGLPGGTSPFSINAAGATTGIYVDAEGTWHGFERDAQGNFVNFSAPDAGTGVFLTPQGPAPLGTRPSTNNASGEVAGWYLDASGVYHGFVWQP